MLADLAGPAAEFGEAVVDDAAAGLPVLVPCEGEVAGFAEVGDAAGAPAGFAVASARSGRVGGTDAALVGRLGLGRGTI